MTDVAEKSPVPEWPKSEPDAAEIIRYAVGRGLEVHAMAWGILDEQGPAEGAFLRKDYMALTVQMIHLHDIVMLLKALQRLDAAEADRVAGAIWCAADAGDSYGEWLWEWGAECGLDPDAIDARGREQGRRMVTAPAPAASEASR